MWEPQRLICNVSGSYIYPAIAVVSALMFSLYLVAEEDPYLTNDDVMQYLSYGYFLMQTPSPTAAWFGVYSLMMAASRCQEWPDPPTGCGMACLDVEGEVLLQRASFVSVCDVLTGICTFQFLSATRGTLAWAGCHSAQMMIVGFLHSTFVLKALPCRST
jgi:hypothetical protein